MLIEILSAFGILIIAFLFLNPGNLSMPMGVISTLIITLIISFTTFAAYILNEKATDERASLHILRAGRVSYLVGVGILILGIVVQALQHAIDSWLVLSLCGMILSKILSRIYFHFKM